MDLHLAKKKSHLYTQVQCSYDREKGSKSEQQYSLHCRRILGGRNLVRVRNVVVAAIFDFMTVEDWGE